MNESHDKLVGPFLSWISVFFLLLGDVAFAQEPAPKVDQVRDAIKWASNQVNLARMSCSLGDTNEAERLFREVLALPLEELKADHPTRLSAQADLISMLLVMRRFKVAEEELGATIQLQERVLGPEHPQTLRSRYTRTILREESGRPAEEETELRAILQIQDRKFGRDHPDTLKTRNGLARALIRQRKFKEAEPEIRYVLEARQRLLGPEHRDTIDARNALATALYGQDKHREAEPEYRAALQGLEHTLGAEHRDTLRALFNLALCLREQYKDKNTMRYSPPEAKLNEARQYARRAYVGAVKLLGTQHPSTKQYKILFDDLTEEE